MSAIASIAQEQYRKELKRYLMRRLRNPHDVEDVTQDVLIRLLGTSDSKLILKPLAYVYGTASHVLADHRIDLEQRQGLIRFDSEEVEEAEDSLVEPDTYPDRLNLQQQLEKALLSLPETHRKVFWLHKAEGLSYEECAEQLGLSIHTIEKYITQSKARLRAMSWDR